MKSDDERSWAANRGYDDHAGEYYSYDSNVSNARRVSVGDLVVVRENDFVCGWGIIEHIEVFPNATKEVSRCPNCLKTNFYARKTLRPANACSTCRHQFENEDAIVSLEPVTQYRCHYAKTWIEAERPMHAKDLKPFLLTRDSYNAIRPLNPDLVEGLVNWIGARDLRVRDELPPSLPFIGGGHVQVITRRRRGQRQFRLTMLEKFGESCAFSGKQPPQVLEAAHLYSFAEQPDHKIEGGLLLRRDFHALFDLHLLRVNPEVWTIEVSPRIMEYEDYGSLDQAPLLVDESLRPDQDLVAVHFADSAPEFEAA